MIDKKLIAILNKDIYPALSKCVDKALPEFKFMEKGNKWISTNTLHLSGIEGRHGKGKVTIAKDKPYVIGDWREGTLNLIKYLTNSMYHSKITDFETAVKYLASITGIEIDGQTIDTKNYESAKIYKRKSKPIYDIIPSHYVEASFRNYEENNFVLFLDATFGTPATNKAIKTYLLGTSKHQFKFGSYVSTKGSVVFWQIDTKKKIRTGRVMLYDAKIGKRRTEPNNHVTWVHYLLKRKKLLLDDFILNQCLFGEHLLKKNNKRIGVVESEKTAVIMSILMPEKIWLACGGNWGINKERFEILKRRDITLYPDLGQYKHWKEQANKLNNFSITVSTLLENKATDADRQKGWDIADYLLKNMSQ